MSYCVNCGVELDKSAVACPLCNTKIYHPGQPVSKDAVPPYATVKGYTEPVKAKEFTILMTIILITTSLVCVFLNLFTIQIGRWSAYVVGICTAFWVFFLPLFFPQKTNIYVNVGLDGVMVALFLAIVSWLHPGNRWYFDIALPIIGMATVLLEVIFFFAIHLKSSMLIKTVIFVASIAAFCMVTEMVIDLHYNNYFYLRWSAVVAICALVIDIILMTIYLRSGLRAEIRRRMHF